MSARYQVLNNEKQPLYAEGSPVIVCAKALTKDTAQNKVLAQIRFKSISKNILTGLTVALLPKDAAGRPIDDEVHHAYLDLNVNRDTEFGADQAIYFNDETIRDYDIVIKECIYKNNGACQIGKTLQTIKAPQTLDGLDADMLQQYREDIHCANARYKYQSIMDLWQCTCGEYNHDDEQTCHSCNVSRRVIQTGLDLTVLAEKVAQKKQKEYEEDLRRQEDNRIRREEAAKKQKKVAKSLAICTVIALVIGVAAKVTITNHKINTAKKEIETYISEGEYSDATNAIRESELSEADKEDYYLQIVNNLYQNGKYSVAKVYSDNIISDEGKDTIAQIQADYFLAGTFNNYKEMWELKQICLDKGTINQDQADEIETTASAQQGWPTEEEYQQIIKQMAIYVEEGAVPLDFLCDARNKDIEFEDAEQKMVSENALSLFDEYKGAYMNKERHSNSDDFTNYYVLDETWAYHGFTFVKSGNSIVQLDPCQYNIRDNSIGDFCKYYEQGGKLYVKIEEYGTVNELRPVDQSKLPETFIEQMEAKANSAT